MPNLTSLDILFIKNLLPKLNLKFYVDLTWLVAIPKSHDNSFSKLEKDKIIFYYDYQSIDEILEKCKPDIVFVRPSLEPINLSLLLGSKEKGIITITSFFNRLNLSSFSTSWKGFSTNFRSGMSNKIYCFVS